MGVRILANADDTSAVLFCGTSDWAFGPVFHDDVSARAATEEFLTWLRDESEWIKYDKCMTFGRPDARSLSDKGLSDAYADWLLSLEKTVEKVVER